MKNLKCKICICIISFISREGNHPDDYSRLTYRKLLEEVCRFANVLKNLGVRKGDRVSIYMPMVLELAIAMLACARIGAVHSIVVSDILLQRFEVKFSPLSILITISALT